MLTRMYVELDILKESLKERVCETLNRLREKEDGAALVEYALLVAGITIAVAAAAFALYNAIAGRLNNASTLINTGAVPAP